MPGALELYAFFVTQVMPGVIENESNRLTNKYLEGELKKPLGLVGVGMVGTIPVSLLERVKSGRERK